MSMSSPVKDFLIEEGDDHGFLYGFFFFWYMRLFNSETKGIHRANPWILFFFGTFEAIHEPSKRNAVKIIGHSFGG